MPSVPNIEETITFIMGAHAGQTYGPGIPYHLHPMGALQYLPGSADTEVKQAVLLHDIIEKTKYTADDLRGMGYTERTVKAVELVTRRPGIGVYKEEMGQDYTRWIKAIIDTGNIDAIQVKYADLSMNSNIKNLENLGSADSVKADRLILKYKMPMILLRDAMEAHGLLAPRGRRPGDDKH